jgi:hypothetical protein
MRTHAQVAQEVREKELGERERKLLEQEAANDAFEKVLQFREIQQVLSTPLEKPELATAPDSRPNRSVFAPISNSRRRVQKRVPSFMRLNPTAPCPGPVVTGRPLLSGVGACSWYCDVQSVR